MAKGDIKAGKGALIGGAGEYLVVGELLKRGWLAALTPRGMKHFDVFATKGDKTIYLRVKTKSADADIFRWNRRKGGQRSCWKSLMAEIFAYWWIWHLTHQRTT